MKSLLCLPVFFVLFVGCSTMIPPSEVPDRLPTLIYQPPLPAYPSPVRELHLDVKLHITADGTVTDVQVVNSTGDREWDALALAEMRKWRYSPAQLQGKPIALWITQTVRVQFGDPLILSLAEIWCATEAKADSVYRRLSEGGDFGEIAREVSLAESRQNSGLIGAVDIRVYPIEIQRELRGLREGDWTEPLAFGDAFAIFKRLKKPETD